MFFSWFCLFEASLTPFPSIWGGWVLSYKDPKRFRLVKHEMSQISRLSGWWFQIFFIFTSIWRRFPFWLIFFRWAETTNQLSKNQPWIKQQWHNMTVVDFGMRNHPWKKAPRGYHRIMTFFGLAGCPWLLDLPCLPWQGSGNLYPGRGLRLIS